MRRTLGVAAAALAVAAGLLLWRAVAGAPTLAYYAPDDYVERADRFIAAGWLVADCSGAEPRLVPRLGEAPAAERAWYEASYLAADVTRFNREPESFGWAFALDEGCALRGVNPVVHRVELPFAGRPRWLGWILYGGGGSDAALRSPRRAITLRAARRPMPARDTATTEVGQGGELVQEGVVLLHFAGGPAQPAARVWAVGEEVVVANRIRQEHPEAVRLMGHRLPVGRLARLETGDWLNLAAAGPARREETFVFLGGETLEAASVVRRRNERTERRSEEAGLGRLPQPGREGSVSWLDLVAGGVDAALAALPARRAAGLADSFDLQLTVERDLQLAMSRRLGAAAERLRGTGPPFSAGLTLMDGRTGGLLALASYPGPEAVAAAPELEGAARRRLLHNQNLVRHPIGSAGKPFFFAAVAAAHPFLLDLELDPHASEEERDELFHCELASGYQVIGAAGAGGGRLGFARALEVSSNRYAVELATLALAAREGVPRGFAGPLTAAVPADRTVEWPPAGGTSGAWIGGRPLTYAPDLGDYVLDVPGRPRRAGSAAARRCAQMDRLELVPFRAVFDEVTGAASYRGRAPRLPADTSRRRLELSYATGRYDLRPWTPLLAHLAAGAGDEAAWEMRAAFQAVAPERVDLAFNQVSRLREDFVSLPLGGATSTWTDVQLAEAMSRLVSGRRVEARLAAGVLPREPGRRRGEAPAAGGEPAADPLPPALALPAEVRGEVLVGLARVVEGPGGTARSLGGALARVRAAFPGDGVWMFSKTGSPTVLAAVPASAARALVRLVESRRLRLEGGSVVVVVGGRATPWRRRGAAGRAAWEAALARAGAEAGVASRAAGATAPAIDEVAATLAAGGDAARLEGPLAVRGGRLVLARDDDLFRRHLVRGRGAVYVFTLVRVPGAAGAAGSPTVEQLAAPDTRILTGAVHFATGPGASVAVDFTEDLLPDLVPLLR